ncbi:MULTISPECIES: hypothetical protein [Microbacterium]|nr:MULTISPECIES: hypothetical protein [Microbacterium]
MLWTLIGRGIEIVGLAVAAYGLFLSWRGVADGHPLIPLRRRHRRTGVAASGTVAISASAYGYVTHPDETVDEKLARVHSVLATLDRRITTETHDREQSIARLASAVRVDWDRENAERKAEARSDTRVAVAGLCFAAIGAVLQLIGSATL